MSTEFDFVSFDSGFDDHALYERLLKTVRERPYSVEAQTIENVSRLYLDERERALMEELRLARSKQQPPADYVPTEYSVERNAERGQETKKS